MLLIAPAFPKSFWSFSETNRIVGARTLLPPLGLLTVAAMLPEAWELRLADLNVRALSEEDWAFADIVMVSAMLVQREGALAVVAEARQRGKTVVAGGPYPSSSPEEVMAAGCDFLIQGEGENTVPQLLSDLGEGRPGRVIANEEKPSLSSSPVPRFDLLDLNAYGCVSVQTSRGCPFDCEFCDVVNLYGRLPRNKAPGRVLAELEALYLLGWRGDLFIADDNFIGNKVYARHLLRELIPWMEARGKPFGFITQTSVNLGQDRELIDLMTAANFGFVFVGVESPSTEVLARSNKIQNIRNPLAESLHNINRNGLTVIASFVLGLDGEERGAGGRIEEFVEETGVPLVALNILQCIPNTRLWDRLKREGRLRTLTSGDTTSARHLNFEPSRPEPEIVEEYLALWDRLDSPRRYYGRVHRYILEMRPTRRALGLTPRVEPPGDTGPVPDRGYRAALWHLFWRRALLSPLNLRLWMLTLDVLRRNPSRLKRFFILCAMGENLFPLRRLVHRQAESAT